MCCMVLVYLEQNRKHGSVPVIGNNNTVLSRAERQSCQCFYGSLIEEHKTLLIVRVV